MSPEGAGMSGAAADTLAVERASICFPHHDGSKGILQRGDAGFRAEIQRLYSASENNALEQLIDLKRSLRSLSTDDFWAAVTEGMSKILGAEICFVVKRVLVDDQESAVEMPPLGEPGSCLMAAALHYCANDGSKSTSKSTKFHAWGCPCAYMRHDKVFCVPDRLSDFFNNNPNKLPTPCEAYIAVPLFEEGMCFAHFGAMWSKEAAADRKLSWAFIEMILHSLEDMISQRFLQGSDFVGRSSSLGEKPRVIPHEAVTVAQSLRPYAGSLSHELRTPMQGVVGMLDVMYATVLEAYETQADPRVRQVFKTLKDNIEIVQDSSRRAVEAADNVVHAYDMDMSIPEAPTLLEEDSTVPMSPYSTATRQPEILVAGSNLPLSRPKKRRRDEAFPLSRHGSDASVAKTPRRERTSCSRCSEQDVQQAVQQADQLQSQSHIGATMSDLPTTEVVDLTANAMTGGAHRIIAPGLRHTSLRELLQHVINEALKVGGRPDSAMAQETDSGEIIEVRTRGSDGTIGQKTIEWTIDPTVPSTMYIDEKDLSKLISCVFLNAIKFTDKENGHIRVHAKLSSRGRYISIKVSDNGPGIPAAFLPKLFTPFARENASITRSSEGLGLGLMVAKGIARKLGGDLMCTRAETNGPDRGTEFDIKVPLHAGETISRPASPYGSPLPRRANLQSDPPHIKPLPAAPGSPRKFSRALHEVVNEGLFCAPFASMPPTPPSPNSVPGLEHNASPSSSSPPSPPPTESTMKPPRPRIQKSVSNPEIDRDLANKYPLTFLVAEDNKINRKLLVSMLSKFGYKEVHEAHDGAEAVRQMAIPRPPHSQIDIVLMDLWMPLMDGYEATEKILGMDENASPSQKSPTVLAVTADVTDGALERAAEVGMKGFMTKPYKLLDLQRLITEYCANHQAQVDPVPVMV